MNTVVFATSSDYTLMKLLDELNDSGRQVSCLIQSSRLNKYVLLYPGIKFIDIHEESFYSLSESTLDLIKKISWDELYIVFSGRYASNYGNVLDIVEQCTYKHGYFYNCEGEKTEIKKDGAILTFLIGIYIAFIGLVYRG